MDKQKRMDKLYLDLAYRISQESVATRSKVGAIIVKNNNICSFGWNGVPSGVPNDSIEGTDENGNIVTNPMTLHAESNAMMKMLRHGSESTEGATLYITLSPCYECAKMIFQSGITRLVYLDEYRIIDGLNFLKEMGIQVTKYEEPDEGCDTWFCV